MWNARHDLIAARCAWCNLVWTGQGWILERRAGGREMYSHGICESCAAIHFSSLKDRGRLNVEQFRMKPRPAAGAATG